MTEWNVISWRPNTVERLCIVLLSNGWMPKTTREEYHKYLTHPIKSFERPCARAQIEVLWYVVRALLDSSSLIVTRFNPLELRAICPQVFTTSWNVILEFCMQLSHPCELALGLHLTRFPEALQELLEEMQPNRITEFVYDLSQKFSAFYNDCQVFAFKLSQNCDFIWASIVPRQLWTVMQAMNLLSEPHRIQWIG